MLDSVSPLSSFCILCTLLTLLVEMALSGFILLIMYLSPAHITNACVSCALCWSLFMRECCKIKSTRLCFPSLWSCTDLIAHLLHTVRSCSWPCVPTARLNLEWPAVITPISKLSLLRVFSWPESLLLTFQKLIESIWWCVWSASFLTSSPLCLMARSIVSCSTYSYICMHTWKQILYVWGYLAHTFVEYED